jgi:hypothetical protein
MAENRHSVIVEGMDVGLIGGLSVAAWFLVIDTIQGRPLLTPSVLGQIVLFGDGTPDTSAPIFGAVIVYTAFHFAIFWVLGMALVALVHWAVTNPVARFGILPAFLAFEVLFYGFLIALSQETQRLFPFWRVLAANTVAAVAMAIYLWVRHPELRRRIRETPLGDAPV